MVPVSHWLQFLGALRDTFNLCEKYLKRNETDEEYLTVTERNTLLSAIVGLAGCVTFTGVARDEKYVELCGLALEKLEPVFRKLGGTPPAPPAAAPAQQQQYPLQYVAQQQSPQQPQQPLVAAYYARPAVQPSHGYWNRGQAAGGHYRQAPGWSQLPPRPWPWPGQRGYPNSPYPQQPRPGNQ